MSPEPDPRRGTVQVSRTVAERPPPVGLAMFLTQKKDDLYVTLVLPTVRSHLAHVVVSKPRFHNEVGKCRYRSKTGATLGAAVWMPGADGAGEVRRAGCGAWDRRLDRAAWDARVPSRCCREGGVG